MSAELLSFYCPKGSTGWFAFTIMVMAILVVSFYFLYHWVMDD